MVYLYRLGGPCYPESLYPAIRLDRDPELKNFFSLAIGGKTNTPALCYLLNAVCWLVGCPVTVDPKIVAPLRFTSHRLHFISTDRIQDNN